MSTCSREAALFYPYVLPKRTHVDWNWPISREKYLEINWSVKMPLHWLIVGGAGGLMISALDSGASGPVRALALAGS